MKKLFILPLAALSLLACQGGDHSHDATADQEEVAAPSVAYFGEEITEEGAVSSNGLLGALGQQDSIDMKVTGRIDKVCQVKGCWMTMAYGEGESMRVSFRDYGFFVPKDVDGKDAVIEGTLYMETTSVEDLRHFAEDEGKSADEIAMITEPETSLTFVADGVIIKDYVVQTDAAEADEQHMEEEEHDHSTHEH
jgi:hypothetical protein